MKKINKHKTGLCEIDMRPDPCSRNSLTSTDLRRLFLKATFPVKELITGFICITFLFSTGCGTEFEEPNILSKPRIMAIQASKPDLRPGDTTSIAALIFDIEADREIHYKWKACMVTDGAQEYHTCDPELEVDLGTEATATFELPFSKEEIEIFCEEIRNMDFPEGVVIPECDELLNLTIVLTITMDGVTEGFGDDGALMATKRLKIVLDDEKILNRNPEITGMNLAELEIEAESIPEVNRGEEVELGVIVDQSSSEEFLSKDKTEREELWLSWYSSAGVFESFEGYHTPGGERNFGDFITNTLTVPEDGLEQPLVVIVTLRDSRGGIDWIIQSFKVL